MSEQYEELTKIARKRLDLCKRIEGELREQGRHEDAEMLATLRKGYSVAIATVRDLYRQNMALRRALQTDEVK